MFNTLKKRIKNEEGLSLVELLAVIVILAIVAAIAIPAIGNIIESSRVKAAKADAANVLNAGQIFFLENPEEETFTGTAPATDESKWAPYITDLGTIESFTVTKVGTGNTVTTSGKSGGKAYSIEAATLSELDLDNGKVGEKFSWGTKKVGE
ncbi:prepilin-type N-terminal cleavage/methylation domain-containing protein [Solibacillus sp. FSL K6-1126]|uniref:prepilin-type N-terminal cleavage/methylation domain-containing protein n=1 Tax=Solibacillus sp. FSL K6-1126 TaxID=2921463 RepID=UPI0030F6F204